MKRAQMTIDATTQRDIRTVRNLLNKRLSTQSYRLKITAPGPWFTDTFHARDPSITRQDKAAQMFSNGKGYVELIHILSKSKCYDGLSIFINEVGIPEHLVSDGGMEERGYVSYKTKWNELQRKYQFKQTFIQPHVPRQNTTELDIGHLRREIGRRTAMRCRPRKLWGYCGMYCAGIKQRMVSTDLTALGRTSYEHVHGYTPNITLYTRHDWHDIIVLVLFTEQYSTHRKIPWTVRKTVWCGGLSFYTGQDRENTRCKFN